MEATQTWTPEPKALPWDRTMGHLRCPGCSGHDLGQTGARYELVLDGVGLDGGDDHHDALRILRRAPDFGSGPFEVPALSEGMPAIAVIDYLERQTFDAREAADIITRLAERFPDATVHAWAVDGDVSHRIAEDAYWDRPSGYFIRSPTDDCAPHEYPADVGWEREAEHVTGPAGRSVELWRGCLYVDPMSARFVRYGWQGLPGTSLKTDEATSSDGAGGMCPVPGTGQA